MVQFHFSGGDNRPFNARNAPHERALQQVIEWLDSMGVDAVPSGTEMLGHELNQQIRAAVGANDAAEGRYFPDLKCRVRATGQRFYLEVKTGYRASSRRCAVEWRAYQEQMALAEYGLRIVWLFDHGMTCWIQDVEFCTPVWDGVDRGRTPFRLVDGHGAFLRSREQFLYEEFGCQPQ